MGCIPENSFKVLIKANSNKNEVLGYDDARCAYRVSIEEPPEDNRANIALVKFLSKKIGKRVKIISGHKGKIKTMRVE
jgi:uncharacterized protein (TIGR00251 family)